MNQRGLLEVCEVVHEDVEPEVEDPVLDIIEELVNRKMVRLQKDIQRAEEVLDTYTGSKENKAKLEDFIKYLNESRAGDFEGSQVGANKEGRKKLREYVKYLEEVRSQELIAGELGSHLRTLEMNIKTLEDDLAEDLLKRRELGLSNDQKEYFEKRAVRLQRSITQ